MKKILFTFIALTLFLSFAGCEERSANEVRNESESTETGSSIHSNILVVYFSMPESSGIDALAGASRVDENGIVLGNTQWVADRIVELIGATQFAIKTVQDYPGSHKALVEQGTTEKRTDARPELRTHISNLDDYDVIFIGYPIWWAELPMPLYSFLEEYDFSGKKIIPFSTHGGSQLAGTIDTLKEKLPYSEVVENAFTVSRDHVRESRASIADWLDELGGI